MRKSSDCGWSFTYVALGRATFLIVTMAPSLIIKFCIIQNGRYLREREARSE